MNEAPTTIDEASIKKAPQDIAPPTVSQRVGGVGNELGDVAIGRDIAMSSMVHLEPKPRKKTWGEKVFNFGTYGGVALLGNEATSLIITRQAEDGIFKTHFTKFQNWFKKFDGKPSVPEYIGKGQIANVLMAVLGGMLMVPFVKYLEDNKGSIVRTLDRDHYGTKADTHPQLVEAHKEMDQAPKQTWGSLWKGRALTVASAIGVDYLVGWKDATSTKFFKDKPTFQKFASMDRIADQIAEKSVKALNISPAARPAATKWIQKGTWLLTLSSTLTVLFYVSSKIFASKRDEKLERMHHRAHEDGTLPTLADQPEGSAAVTLDRESTTPSTHIHDVAHLSTLGAAPQLAHGA
jgi:hypothetical protein